MIFFMKGTGKKFEGDLELWLRLLTPKDSKRIYNLQSKQIIKLFSRIFDSKLSLMQDDLNEGDVSKTVAKFFEKSRVLKPAPESSLTIFEVDKFLDKLSGITTEDLQIDHFTSLCKKCTAEDLKTIIRMIKHDLKMNCGTRHVLDALHANAYDAFQKSRNLKAIIKEFKDNKGGSSGKTTKSGLTLMTPISPMLAEACKDFDKAMKKCPEGFYSEVKYDGERVQIHKEGNEFKFFSRNLKISDERKVGECRKYLPKAFPHADDLIMDAEILAVDTKNGSLLPFATLGAHKIQECPTAVRCLFIFDCLHFNGEDLTQKPMQERRKFLEDNLTVIKHRVQLSEYQFLKTKNELVVMTKQVLEKGLEGLVLKGLNTIYEPGKRRWLKVKKDYLLQGDIADTADLVVLGAWFGTGKMGGLYSTFLMGCFDKSARVWKTVTKVHGGLDDREMDRMHRRIDPLMEKPNRRKMPDWIQLTSTMIPDAIAKDPMKMPVFEVTGAEFTESTTHTAISIRFPRITKVRDDKSPDQATNLKELLHLYQESKSGVNLDELNKLKTKDSSESKVKVTSITTNLSTTSKAGNLKRKSSESDSGEDQETKVKVAKMQDADVALEGEVLLKRGNPEDSLKKEPNANGKRKSDNGSQEDECPSKKVKVANTSESIFDDFLLFMTADIKEKFSDETDEFVSKGGKITNDSRAADLVLYDCKEFNGDIQSLRKLYNPFCRHFQVSWLKESLKAKKPKNPLHYFVKLHQV